MLKYQIALINVFWSENDINTRYFENVDAQNAYFDKLTGGMFSPLVNFNMGDNINTSVIFRDISGRSGDELCKCNYAVIEKIDDSGSIISRRYFFAYPQQDSGGQMRVTLSLDDIQTNYITYKNTISPCLIRRACLERFDKQSNGTYSFKGDIMSNLFLREPIGDTSQQFISMQSLKWKYTRYDDLNDWLNEYVAYWVYLFMDQTKKYKVYSLDGHENLSATGGSWGSGTEGSNSQTLFNDYAIFCYPVYKSNISSTLNAGIKIKLNNFDTTLTIDKQSEYYFRENNNDTSYYFAKKISLFPPFRSLSNYTISGNLLTINNNDDVGTIVNPVVTSSSLGTTRFAITQKGARAMFGGIEQSATPMESYPIQLDYNLNFSKEQLKGNSSLNYNPKLLSMDNMTIKLKSFDGSSFDYDLQKLNSNTLTFLYNETLQPEITKYYCRIKPPSGLYFEDTDKNFLGLVGSTDNTIAVSNDQYALFLANNKNFWMQTAFQLVGNAGNTIGRSMVGGQPIGVIGGIASAVSDTLTTIFDKSLTIDNMKESPDTLKNSGGNALFSTQIKDFSIFVEIHCAIGSVLKNRNDYNILYGLTLDQVGLIYNYDNIRTYYNYVEADVETITAPISNTEKDRLRQKLKSVRFWNSDTIQYTLENYERSIDDE